jgi:hypothetical protein
LEALKKTRKREKSYKSHGTQARAYRMDLLR